MKKPNSFLLVYGSETGQAKAIAEQIAEKSLEFGLEANLHCLDQTEKKFNIEKETCMVMVTSTTGDGDAPENASKFLRRIKKKTLSSDYLIHLNYAVLGLGDTNYNNFCKCAKDMDARLEQLGAKRFYPTGLADDGTGLELVVDPWLENLYPALIKFLGEGDNHTQLNGTSTSITESVSSLTITSKNGNGKDGLGLREQQYNNKQTDSSGVDTGVQTKHIIESGDFVSDKTLIGSDSSKGDRTEVKTQELRVNVAYSDNCDDEDFTQTKDKCDQKVSPSSASTKTENYCETPCVKIDVQSAIVKSDLKSSLTDSCPYLENKDLTIPVLGPAFLHVNYNTERVETENLSFQNGCKLPSAASEIVNARVSQAKVLTRPGSVKKTLWLRIKLQDQEMTYCPWDSVSVICENNRSEVDLLLERLEATHLADTTLTLSLIPDTKKRRAAVPSHIHHQSTLRHILRTCVSLRDAPSKALLRALIEYTSDVQEVRRLQELCSKEGTAEYTKCVREKSVSLLDVLFAFPSCQPPVERLLEFLPRLLPRPYSICSSPETNPDGLDIVFNVVEIPGDRSEGRFYHRRGICTGWLDDITASLQSNGCVDTTDSIEVPMFFRSNQHFRPPSDPSKPLILIGPGTGVAPFIGFLQQRSLQRSKAGDAELFGETWLFTGFRHRDRDFLFQKELEDFASTGVLTRLCACFSRDEGSAAHRYVQDFMKAESASLARLIVEKEALVYVCGDAKNMAKDVSAAFQDILVSEKGLSPDEANACLMKKRLHKSYLEDVWV